MGQCDVRNKQEDVVPKEVLPKDLVPKPEDVLVSLHRIVELARGGEIDVPVVEFAILKEPIDRAEPVDVL
jgi:hypothetical protein